VAPAGSTGDKSRSADGVAEVARGPNAISVFHAKGLSKTYHVGEVDVHALRDVYLDIFERPRPEPFFAAGIYGMYTL
jgi:putative ABC transport system ATP-binding protein